MVGSGTTLVECKLLGRRAVGMDTNPDAVMVARNRLDFSYAPLDADYVAPEIKTYVGNARSLDAIESKSIDLIATHPPYASIVLAQRESNLSKPLGKVYQNEGVCKAYPNTAQAEVSAFERAQYRRVRRGNAEGRHRVHARAQARETLRHPYGRFAAQQAFRANHAESAHEFPQSRVHFARGYHQVSVEDEKHEGKVVREEL